MRYSCTRRQLAATISATRGSPMNTSRSITDCQSTSACEALIGTRGESACRNQSSRNRPIQFEKASTSGERQACLPSFL